MLHWTLSNTTDEKWIRKRIGCDNVVMRSSQNTGIMYMTRYAVSYFNRLPPAPPFVVSWSSSFRYSSFLGSAVNTLSLGEVRNEAAPHVTHFYTNLDFAWSEKMNCVIDARLQKVMGPEPIYAIIPKITSIFVSHWAAQRQLAINVSKCHVLSTSRIPLLTVLLIIN